MGRINQESIKHQLIMGTFTDTFSKQLIDHGFKYCSDNPTTYVRIDKDLSTKFFIFMYEGNNGAKIDRIVFSLRLELPTKMIVADEQYDPILLWNMTHRSNWYQTIVDRLCEKINRFYYDTLSKPKKQDQE